MTARERAAKLGWRIIDGGGEPVPELAPFGCAVTFSAEESSLDETTLAGLIDSRLRVARAHLRSKAGIEEQP